MTHQVVLSEQAKTFPKGIYEHYKGNRYEVLTIAFNEATLEEYVVYKELYGEGRVWLRPLRVFCEEVRMGNGTVPRFRYVYTS